MFNRMATNFEVTHCETSASYKWKYLDPLPFSPQVHIAALPCSCDWRLFAACRTSGWVGSAHITSLLSFATFFQLLLSAPFLCARLPSQPTHQMVSQTLGNISEDSPLSAA